MSEDKPVLEEIPEGQVGVSIVNADDFGVGLSPELPGHLLLIFKKVNIALAFPFDNSAILLHDRVCAVLEAVASELLESEEFNPGSVKHRLDN